MHQAADQQLQQSQEEPFNQINWKWDYCSEGNSFWSTKHTKDNKKTFECKANGLDCGCFARCNTPMTPNSGIYKIRFKIDKISNVQSLANTIGISCNKDNNNKWHDQHHYWYYSKEYIGWSSYKIKTQSFEYAQYIPVYVKKMIYFINNLLNIRVV